MPPKRILFRLGFFYLSLIGFFGHIFPRRLMFSLAVLTGSLYWGIMKRDREMVRRNLGRIVQDPSQVPLLVRRTFIRYAKYLVDYTRMDLLRENHVPGLVQRFEGWEHIDRAVAEGRGGLILTAHLGNWEMGGIFLALLGYPLTVVTAPDVEARLHSYRANLRHGQKIRVITLDDTLSSSLAVLRSLQANELVALLGDRDLFGKGVPVTFFGRRVYFPVGPALLASLSEAPLIPTFVLMDETDRYRCFATAPILIQKTGNRDEDLAANTQRIAEVMETVIRAHPDQWYTFYDYFAHHGVL
jgi:KDO2-lipid IV(A) lauroyltransferase